MCKEKSKLNGVMFVSMAGLKPFVVQQLREQGITPIPLEKRYMIAPGLNKDPEIWKRNNTDREYNSEIKKEMEISLTGALKGAEIVAVAGASVGTLVPVIGTAIGAAVGAALGFLGGLFGK